MNPGREANLQSQWEVNCLWTEVHKHKGERRECDRDGLESLPNVRNVVNEADHRGHEKHAN